jgi:hypothetical protein
VAQPGQLKYTGRTNWKRMRPDRTRSHTLTVRAVRRATRRSARQACALAAIIATTRGATTIAAGAARSLQTTVERYHLRVVTTGQGRCLLSNPSVSWLRGKMRERAALMLTKFSGSSRTDLDQDQIMVERGNVAFLFYVARCSGDDRTCEGECDATCSG